jgi:small subunit ribosomal protein S7
MEIADEKPMEKKERAPRVKEDPVKKELEARLANIKLFGRWDSNIDVNDPGLKRYINLVPKIIPRTSGVNQKSQFHKSKMHIVERLALHVMVSGHASKKHKITSGKFGGGFQTAMKNVENAFEIMEKKAGKNPVEMLVRAIENSALCEEIAAYQVGGTIARQAVITAPQRRVDKVLRLFAQGAYKDSFNKKTAIAEALASELLNAFEGNSKSMAIRERERVEQEAAGAR